MILDFKPSLSENTPNKKPAPHRNQPMDSPHKLEMRRNYGNKFKSQLKKGKGKGELKASLKL